MVYGRESSAPKPAPQEKQLPQESQDINRTENLAQNVPSPEIYAPASESPVDRKPQITEVREKLIDKAFLAKLGEETIPKDLGSVQVSKEVARAPELVTTATQDEDDLIDSNFDPNVGTTFLKKLAKSKVARALFGIAGMIGVGKSLQTGGEFIERSAERSAAREVIHGEILDSTIERAARDHGLAFEHLTDMNETMTFNDGQTTTRSEMLTVLSDSWTYQLLNPDASGLSVRDAEFNRTRAKGLFSMIEGSVGSYTGDNGKALDARKVFDAYGDQLRMHHNANFTEMLSAITDYSPANLRTHAEIMRHSVLQAPDVRMGFYGMQEYDMDKYSSTYSEHRAEDFKERYDFADKFSIEVIESLDLDANPELRPDAAKATQDAIKAVIHLENQWTQVGTSLEGWNSHEIIRDGFVADSKSYDGKPIEAGIEQFREAEEKAELALKKLAALEKNPDGSIHKMVEALLEAQEEKAEKVFSQATHLGQGAEEFFTKELTRYE